MTDHACPGVALCRLCAHREGRPDPTTQRVANEVGKRRGMDRVESHNVEWRNRALTKMRDLCIAVGPGAYVSNNDVKALMGDDQPDHPNAWGPLWRAAAARGLVEMTDHTIKSTTAAANASRMQVWRVILGAEQAAS